MTSNFIGGRESEGQGVSICLLSAFLPCRQDMLKDNEDVYLSSLTTKKNPFSCTH